MVNRLRNLQIKFYVTPEELKIIEDKMERAGVTNREAYLRKIAMDGCVVQLEIPELKEILRLMRYTSNNVNQIARHMHETGRVYDTDLEDVAQKQDAIRELMKSILVQLGKLS